MLWGTRVLGALVAALGSVLFLGISPVAAEVQPGDLAIIRVNHGGTGAYDSFSWIALRDIEEGEQIRWTDSSWGASLVEGVRQGWHQEDNSSNSPTPLFQGPIAAGTVFDVSLTLGLTAADQVFMYTGAGPEGNQTISEAAAGLIFGITWDGPGWIESGSTSNTKSYEPAGLAALGATVELGSGAHWFYSGDLVTGTAEQLLAEIRNPANWSTASEDKTTWGQVSDAAFQVLVPGPSLAAGALGCVALGFALRRRRDARAG